MGNLNPMPSDRQRKYEEQTKIEAMTNNLTYLSAITTELVTPNITRVLKV